MNDTITIPANIAMTDFAGNIKMTLIIECAQSHGDSISIPYYYFYSVTPLAGYKEVGGIVNPTLFAKVDMTNVADAVFAAKAAASGIHPTTNIPLIDGGGA
ncbi:hypothetical protein MHBO_003830 [Bonamia ostreae]|uniref:Uncharacterized protein n=1 Tax=Bonamia ostreae TaxID=126728 RepID=A0ABV2ARM0_9EUKA